MPRSLLRGVAGAVDWVIPKSRRRVLLYSIPAFDDTVRALVAELGASWQVTVVVDRLDEQTRATARELAVREPVARTHPRALWAFMRSRTVFVTHEVFPLGPGRARTLVNVWHGELTKPIALWGHDRPVRSTYALTCSKLGAAFRCSEFGLPPDRVLVTGLPRNDVMLTSDAAHVRRSLGMKEDTPFLVWLPTWRHSSASKDSAKVPPDLGGVLRHLNPWLERSGVQVVVKAHPLAKLPARELSDLWVSVDDDWIRERGLTLYQLLGASDGLVTDASSVWVDYLLLDRPVWIHFPDAEAWERDGSLLLEPYASWLPGPQTTTAPELESALSQYFDRRLDAGREQRAFLRSVMHRHQDAEATRRLLARLGMSPAP